VDAAALTRALLQAAAHQGARLWFGLRATGLLLGGAAVCGVRTQTGSIAADQVIVAAGTGAAALLAEVDHPLPMLPRPGLILRTGPMARAIRHILSICGQELRQDGAGRLIMPLAAHHQADATETPPQDPQALVDAALARLEALFPGAAIRADEVARACRPVPGDGAPAVGAVGPGLWLAVMHSGVTLAPIVTEALAAEVLGQGAHPLLAPYTPARFKV
jgi:glycine/D-amino acid oxidase-like deaminating enzyme